MAIREISVNGESITFDDGVGEQYIKNAKALIELEALLGNVVIELPPDYDFSNSDFKSDFYKTFKNNFQYNPETNIMHLLYEDEALELVAQMEPSVPFVNA